MSTFAPFAAAVGNTLIDRDEFDARLGAALDDGRGFATGKLGHSERLLLRHPIACEREPSPLRRRALETAVAQQLLRHGGTFPPVLEELERFRRRYAADLPELDVIGVFAEQFDMQVDVFRGYELSADIVDYRDQEPDIAARGGWLQSLRGRRILIVCPFAGFLADRARPEIFEAVWASYGAPWFEPQAVDALEFSYGFARSTWERYDSTLELLEEVIAAMAARDFDIALIGAGLMGDSLAVAAKRLRRVGFSVGGHLQPMFGVLGQRWLEDPEYRPLFNDAWTTVPPDLQPDPTDHDTTYW